MSTVLSPLPAFRFQCTLPTVSASTSSSSSGSGAQQGPDVVALLVERFTPPMGSLDSEAVPFQSGSRNFPVGAVSDTMSIQFIEDSNLSVTQYFLNWRALVRDSLGNFGLPSKYKQAVSLTPVGFDGSDVGVFSWASCWPLHITVADFDGMVNGYTSVTVTLAVDFDDFTLNGNGSGSAALGGGAGGASYYGTDSVGTSSAASTTPSAGDATVGDAHNSLEFVP